MKTRNGRKGAGEFLWSASHGEPHNFQLKGCWDMTFICAPQAELFVRRDILVSHQWISIDYDCSSSHFSWLHCLVCSVSILVACCFLTMIRELFRVEAINFLPRRSIYSKKNVISENDDVRRRYSSLNTLSFLQEYQNAPTTSKVYNNGTN